MVIKMHLTLYKRKLEVTITPTGTSKGKKIIRWEVSRCRCSTQSISVKTTAPNSSFMTLKCPNPVTSLTITKHWICICRTNQLEKESFNSSQHNKRQIWLSYCNSLVYVNNIQTCVWGHAHMSEETKTFLMSTSSLSPDRWLWFLFECCLVPWPSLVSIHSLPQCIIPSWGTVLYNA